MRSSETQGEEYRGEPQWLAIIISGVGGQQEGSLEVVSRDLEVDPGSREWQYPRAESKHSEVIGGSE